MNLNRSAVPAVSAVVVEMQRAAAEAHRKWRAHVAAGTVDTPEGLKAFDEAQLAGRVWLDEVADRRAAELSRAARAA